jgi:hypothetical protein
MEARWPQLAALHTSSQSSSPSYFRRHAMSSLAACSRAEMTAALLAQRARGPLVPLSEEVLLAITVLHGASRHDDLLSLLSGGLRSLCAAWRADDVFLHNALTAVRSVVAPPAVFGSGSLPSDFGAPAPGPSVSCPLSTLLFGAAITAGWPWALSLRLFAGLGQGSSCGNGHGFIPERGKAADPSSRWLVGTLSSSADSSLVATLYFDHAAIVFISCTRAVFGDSARLRGPVPAWLQQAKTRWCPDYIRLPLDERGCPIVPKHRVTSIVERRHVWARLIRMDGVTRAAVMGMLCYPRSSWRISPSYLPNHKSWEVDEVKAKLGQKMAAYFFQGAMEFVFPGHPLPSIIEPKGAVPKKGPDKFRDIADAREGNKSLSDWGVRYFTARELAFALTWRAIVNGHDINDGYHIAVLAGCSGILVWGWGVVDTIYIFPGDPAFEPPVVEAADGSFQPAPGPFGPQVRFVFGWRLHVGCWSGNCSQTCDKSFTGMFFDGCVARWAVAHFGQKPAGSPLNCIVLCLLRHAALRGPASGELRGASSRTLLGVAWVDDFAFYHPVPWHPACGGLAGSCGVCESALAQAEQRDEWWMGLCSDLGVSLNMAKHQRCGQAVEYAGLLFDTLRGLLLVLPAKQDSLLAVASSLESADASWTMRELDSAKGRFLHYSIAIRHLRVLVTELGCLMGPVVESSYDIRRPAPAGLAALALEIGETIRRFAPAGRPLWPPVPSSAYAAFLRGDERVLFFSLTWDASPNGWAALLRWWSLDAPGSPSALRSQLLIGSWPSGWDVSHQPFREALGGVLAFEAATQTVDLRGKLALLRNDALSAIAAFRKGSSQSPALQRCALRLQRASAASDIDILPWHVPGLQLVAEGIDGASRGGTAFGVSDNLDSTLGPAISDTLWDEVRRVAAAACWSITVDAFATESNARAARYWSCYGEPGAEAIDALSVGDWAQSFCPVCACWHREVLFAFPPLVLVQAAITKAIEDRALCVLVVPVAILSPYWHKLLSASVLPRLSFPEGFRRIRKPSSLLLHAGTFAPQELAVFACDFSRLSPRDGLPPLAPGCSGSSLRRPRPACGSPGDLADRLLLRERLLALEGGEGFSSSVLSPMRD